MPKSIPFCGENTFCLSIQRSTDIWALPVSFPFGPLPSPVPLPHQGRQPDDLTGVLLSDGVLEKWALLCYHGFSFPIIVMLCILSDSFTKCSVFRSVHAALCVFLTLFITAANFPWVTATSLSYLFTLPVIDTMSPPLSPITVTLWHASLCSFPCVRCIWNFYLRIELLESKVLVYSI